MFDQLLFAEMAIHGLFNHLDAPEIHELGILFQPTVQGHADFPGTCKDLRILNSGVVTDSVFTHRSVSLDNVQSVAMEIAGPVEPCRIGETADVDDKRIP